MKNKIKSILRQKTTLSAFMFVSGLVTVLSKYGCCFFIYHQPKYPEALRMTE